jgi:hypothetical protein
MSSSLWVDDSPLGGVLLFLVFSANCYFHQIVMISVIKLRRVAGLADLHGVNSLILCVCSKLWFECCDFGSIFPLFRWFYFCSMDGWCFFFGIVSFSRCYAFVSNWIPFLYCAPSSGKIWNLLVAFFMYVFFCYV